MKMQENIMLWLGTKFKAVKDVYDKIDRVFYPILGLPSYDKYLEHFKTHYPGEKPLSRGEFIKHAQEDRAKNPKC